MTYIGPVMLDIEGQELSSEDRVLLEHPLVGGVILFTRNIRGPEQVVELCQEIKSIKPSLVLAIDQEGGRVQRIREGVTRLPPLADVGRCYERDPAAGLALSEACGHLMAAEMVALGLDLSFAPVLDIEVGLSEVIGDRAFGTTPDQVIALAAAYITGMQRVGMSAVGKHFPGHGSVVADSHIEIPVDTRTKEQIMQWDVQPFKALCSVLEGIMPAHVIYETVCSQPAGFSDFWIRDVLRKRLSFGGVVFSDDLSMEGATVVGDYLQRAVAALRAGCDMVLVCNKRAEAEKVVRGLEQLEEQSWLQDTIFASQTRLRRLLVHDRLSWQDFATSSKRLELTRIIEEKLSA